MDTYLSCYLDLPHCGRSIAVRTLWIMFEAVQVVCNDLSELVICNKALLKVLSTACRRYPTPAALLFLILQQNINYAETSLWNIQFIHYKQ